MNEDEFMYMVKLKNLNKKDRALRIINYVLGAFVILSCITMMIIHLVDGDPNKRVSACLMTALCVFIPFLIELVTKQRLGNSTIMAFLIFVFVSSFIGSAVGVFKHNDVFDKVCHTCFGYFGCYIGLLLASKMVDIKDHPWHAFIICFLFVMAGASLWEIFEFTGDTFFGGTAQGAKINGITPVTDTMLDIVVTFAGSMLFLFHYAIHIFSKKDLLIDSFIDDNNTVVRDTNKEVNFGDKQEPQSEKQNNTTDKS